LARSQLVTQTLANHQIDIIRKFNVLVDMNYKAKKQVSEYAEMLHKSPKTLANLFSLYNDKTPLRIIHERIVLEGKRLLTFTDLTSKEVAHFLGYEDDSSFSKLFRKITGFSPISYKKSQKELK
jgi:AraC family 4-hydroxyphenylacetate 3-monooxygenase operon regulatory protein